MAAETKITMLLFFVFAFCLVLSNGRMLLEGKDNDSPTLFHKFGFELPNVDQTSFGGSFRFAPSGVDPHHHLTSQLKTSEGLQKPLRVAPGGPDPHHHSAPPDVQFLLREARSGPDFRHHLSSSSVQFPLGFDLSNMAQISLGGHLRGIPSGSNPISRPTPGMKAQSELEKSSGEIIESRNKHL